MLRPNEHVTVTIEKPAAGGRMIARHEGAIVLVAAAIPGETVEIRVEKVQRGTVWAAVERVIEASPDRVAGADCTCGGSVFAHVRYERQADLKRAILHDAFARIARHPLDGSPVVVPSPADGYRMRARLHLDHGRAGFYREGTHQLCDAAATRQLRADSLDAVTRLASVLTDEDGIDQLELAENRDASDRVVSLALPADADPSRLATRVAVEGLTGVSVVELGASRPLDVWGLPLVTDRLQVSGETIVLARRAQSFFQGNRFLLEPLVAHVMEWVQAGTVLDLYAGVGLFSVAAAATRDGPVTAVEGDRTAAGDLKLNATAFRDRLQATHQPVEQYLATGLRHSPPPDTIIVDPPRTGLSREVLAALPRLPAGRLVYVSCDPATLARDARSLMDAGFGLSGLTAFDLFPNTAHVESVAVFSR
jgi:23S rRNA (uracil1939-C5)-methyltransferase